MAHSPGAHRDIARWRPSADRLLCAASAVTSQGSLSVQADIARCAMVELSPSVTKSQDAGGVEGVSRPARRLGGRPTRPGASVRNVAARTRPAASGTGGGKAPGLGGHPGREQSAAAGKAARRVAPLESHRDFSAAASRDPVGLLLGQAESRVPELVPVRHGRMLVSPFSYYRGAALPMAADLAGMRSSGLRVQLCGDAHLLNFGAFASPERRLVFDLNDFDETLPGPFEWDVKRLVASMAVAGRDNGLTAKKRRRVALATAAAYRTAMREFAATSILDVWYARFDAEDALARLKSDLPKKAVRQTKAQIAKARTRDSTQALAKLTTIEDGRRRIISDPPLIVPLEELAGHLDVDAVCLLVPPPPVHRVRADLAGLPAPAGRAILPDPSGPQGRRRRQRRHRDVDLADGTR